MRLLNDREWILLTDVLLDILIRIVLIHLVGVLPPITKLSSRLIVVTPSDTALRRPRASSQYRYFARRKASKMPPSCRKLPGDVLLLRADSERWSIQ